VTATDLLGNQSVVTITFEVSASALVSAPESETASRVI